MDFWGYKPSEVSQTAHFYISKNIVGPQALPRIDDAAVDRGNL